MIEEKNSKGILKKIEEWDRRVFLFFYDRSLFRNKKIRMFAKIYSFFGNMYFWGVLWLIWVTYGYITKDYYLLVLFTGGFIQSISLHILIRYKLVRRNRPFIKLGDHGVKQYDELIRENKSFPSGHVTFVLFFGIIFAYYFNNWIILLTFIGIDVIMAFTRLILGVHFPLDVIFGFIFGAAFALLYLNITSIYWVWLFYWLGEIFSPIIHFWR